MRFIERFMAICGYMRRLPMKPLAVSTPTVTVIEFGLQAEAFKASPHYQFIRTLSAFLTDQALANSGANPSDLNAVAAYAAMARAYSDLTTRIDDAIRQKDVTLVEQRLREHEARQEAARSTAPKPSYRDRANSARLT